MTIKPALDKAYSARGANMGRGWDFPGQPEAAHTVVRMYASDPPKTATERRHLQVAKAFIADQATVTEHATKAGEVLHLKPIVATKVALQRIRLDRGGYDAGGAYWGIGQPLYWGGSDDGLVDLWFRASSRGDAKDKVVAQFRGATFYR
jgi:hypothetical protein